MFVERKDNMNKRRRLLNTFERREFESDERFKRYELYKNIKPRLKILQSLHGKPLLEFSQKREDTMTNIPNVLYDLFNNLSTLGYQFDSDYHYALKPDGKTKIKVTKLLSNLSVKESVLQEFALFLKPLPTYTLTVSTSFRDIIRCSCGNNWRSCYDNPEVIDLLDNPNIGIGIAKNTSGEVIVRWLFSYYPDLKGLMLHPLPYPFKGFDAKSLKSLLPDNSMPIFVPVTRTVLNQHYDSKQIPFEIRHKSLYVGDCYNEFESKSYPNCFLVPHKQQ